MADNTKKPSDSDFHKAINESESNTGALSGNTFSIESDKPFGSSSSFYVRNAMPAPPNPNKDKGNK